MPARRVNAVTNLQRTERSRPTDAFGYDGTDKIEKPVGPEANADMSMTNGSIIYASIVAFIAWTLSVYDFILFGILLPIIAKDFGWSTEFSTFVATWVSVGTFVVALAVGPIVDYLGRRTALVLTTSGAALSSGLAALTFSPIYLIVVRSLSGFGYSEQAVNATYLSEIYGARRRGFFYSLVQGGWPIGVLFASAVSAWLLPLIGWRGTFAVATFPIVVIAILATRLPESPHYEALKQVRRLMQTGRTTEANAFGKARGIDADKAQSLSYLQLFLSDERKHTIWLGLSFLLNWIAIEIFVVLATTILVKAKGVSMHNALLFLVASNALSYVGYVVHGYVGDAIGRRETIMGGWILAGLAYASMILLANGPMAVLISYMIGLFFIIGPYSALFAYMGESYPTRSRGTGVAFINAMGPIGAILGAALLTWLQSTGMSLGNAAVLGGAVPCILSGLALLGARRILPGQALQTIAT
jgi:MFS family permease